MKTLKKIRIFSDLHIDVNRHFPLEMPVSDVFTIIPGDVSGNVEKSIDWIKDHVKQGIVVAGNHIVYDAKKGLELSDLKNKLAEAFPAGGDISFLDCSTGTCSIVKDGVLFIGTTLYTNYEHMNKTDFPCATVWEAIRRNMYIARRCMNDFNKHVPVLPEMYYDMFERDFGAIKCIVTKNEESENPLPVVIVTHHCPSKKFIVPKYEDSELNASFVSDLDSFINEHPSIKAWIAGHIHSKVITKSESGCKLIANPRGYAGDYWFEDFERRRKGNTNPAIFDWNPNVFLDTETWKVFEEDPSGEKKTLLE